VRLFIYFLLLIATAYIMFFASLMQLVILLLRLAKILYSVSLHSRYTTSVHVNSSWCTCTI